MIMINAPIRQTKRLIEIAKNAKKAKQFQRRDHGGRGKMKAAYQFIDEEILAKGGKLSRDAKFLVAQALQKFAKQQIASCRKRTKPPLDEIIRLAGG